MTFLQGMAVLLIRILFIAISYYILSKLNWRVAFKRENDYAIPYFILLMSTTVGHLAGSFIITIIELLQNLLLSSFL